MTLLIIPGIMPRMSFYKKMQMKAQREKDIEHKKRRLKSSQLPIVGTPSWILYKNDGQIPPPSITRNSQGIKRKNSFPQHPQHIHPQILDGWKLNKETNKWTHESYRDVTFDTLVQNTNEGRVLLPCSDENDHLGLAYTYKLSSDGKNMKIYQNRWNNEEFDTRHGRRRNLWEEKKELRKKHTMEFREYQENRHEEGFENRLKERYESQNAYNRDFIID
jgi:hypothetical protein